MRVLILLLALRATSADENDVYASDDNFVSPTQRADETEAALAARPHEPPPAVTAADPHLARSPSIAFVGTTIAVKAAVAAP